MVNSDVGVVWAIASLRSPSDMLGLENIDVRRPWLHLEKSPYVTHQSVAQVPASHNFCSSLLFPRYWESQITAD